MFNSILTIRNSFDTQPDPDSIEDIRSTLHRTVARHRRITGRGRSAGPRDPRGSRLPDTHRRGRLNRGREGLGEV